MFDFKNTPEWIQSAVRQGAAVIGLILTGLNLVETTLIDQLIPLLVSLVLITIDVFRTRDLEDEKNLAVETAQINADSFRALQIENEKLISAAAAKPSKAKTA